MGHVVNQNIMIQPPLLIFMICLTAFGLTMVILAYVVGENDVPNPDVQMDWNTFFKKISAFKLCPFLNDSRFLNEKQLKSDVLLNNIENVLNSSSHVFDESKSMSAILSNVVNLVSDEKQDKSVFLDIAAKVKFKFLGVQPTSAFHVSGKVKGSFLGFSGKYCSSFFNMSLIFIPSHNESCYGEKCSSIWEACVTASLPLELLPEKTEPDTCNSKIVPHNAAEAYHIDLESSSTDTCLILDYIQNPKLTEMLSYQDRSIVNLHLMHTSYFMFVMVMTLVCYSLVKGRHPKHSYSLEKIPLDA